MLPSARAAKRSLEQPPVGDFSNPPGDVPGPEDEPAKPDLKEELVAERTGATQTFLNSDGTKTIRMFDEPKFFQEGDAWREIDNSLVAHPSQPDAFVNAANDWTVTFAPLDRGGVSVKSKAGDVEFAPRGGNSDVAPVIGRGEDANVVTYPQVWPGVDLRYTVKGGEVKEDLVLQSADVTTEFEFDSNGMAWEANEDAPGSLRAQAAPGQARLHIAPPEVRAKDGRPVTEAKPTLRAERSANGSTLHLGVDAAWLKSVPSTEFPVVLDPTVLVNVGAAQWRSYKSDGYTCTGPVCGARVGNSRSAGDTYWRSVLYFPYEAQFGDQATAIHATLHLSQVAGASQAEWVEADWANAWSYAQTRPCTWDGEFCGNDAHGTNVDIDVTQLYDFFLRGGHSGGAIALRGAEAPGWYTYKDYSAYLDLTVNHVAPAPTATAPANGSVVSTLTPTLSANAVSDRDNDTVSYWFRLATSPDAEGGQVYNTGWQSGTSAVIPIGVLQEGRTYYWRAHSYDGSVCCNASPVQSFRVDRRLGADGTQPFDPIGPASVNMANGNLVISTSGPQLPTVGGNAGLAFTYNSQAATITGLSTTFWSDSNANGAFDDGNPIASRVSGVDQHWGTNGPLSPAFNDQFLARFTGYFTAPVTGPYEFGGAVDDGLRVKVNNQLVTDSWTWCGGCWGSAITLTAGQTVPIVIEYREITGNAYLQVKVRGAVPEQVLPTSWLSPQNRVLPDGWSLSTADAVAWQWAMRAGPNTNVVLVDPTGVTEEYRWTGSAFAPPAGGDGILVQNADNTLTLQESDGMEYLFDAGGNLVRATSAVDDRTPAALAYEWAGTPPRLASIKDPLDPTVRKMTLSYGGDAACPTGPPSGAAVAPAGMLCKVSYWDGTASKLWYDTSGRLVRIEDPGAEVTDFGYDAAGRVTRVREPLAADAVAAGIRADDDTTRTLISYDGANRVSAVESALPAVGVARPKHTYDYAAGASAVYSPHSNQWLRKVTFDATGRITSSIDGTQKTSTQEWDAPDRLLASTDVAGRKQTTLYDTVGRVTDTFGPAPASCFGADRRPTSICPTVPSTHTDYDQGIQSLAATYWPNTTMTGPAKIHGTGVGNPDGSIYQIWDLGAPAGLPSTDNWSLRLTGEVLLPAAGTYTLSAYSDDGVRLYVDDQVVFDNFTPHAPAWTSGTFTASTAGAWHRIRLDYFEATGGARLELHWSGPGVSGAIPASHLSPRYGLTTKTTTADSAGVPAEVTATGYASPHLGLPTSTTVDPGGLALTSATTYEAPGSGFLRRTARTLPSGTGSTNTYTYYGATETADDPCTTGTVEVYPQGGMLKASTAADPDGAGAATAIVREQRYDVAGRVVASRIGAEPWTCMTYDSRGRPVSVAYPAFGGAPARTVTTDYAVEGNPLVTATTDPAGTVTATADLLGRVVSYTDVWGKTTATSYDGLGQVTQTVGPAGTLAYTYDPAGRMETMRLDGLLVADPVYDGNGELASVAYPSGAGNIGNGTSLSALGKDAAGRPTSLTWALAGGVSVSDAVTRSQSGKVVDQVIDGVDAYPAGPNFVYDAAGRLTTARVPGNTYEYGFAGTGGCGIATGAGKNTNRTSLTVNGGTPITYCYDHADRLTATTTAGYTGAISYDPHGNTTTIAGETRSYDAADRHRATTKGTTTVTYVRDATDRIVSRSDGTSTVKYAYSATGDTGDATLDAAGNVVEATISLPGGVLLTRRAANTAVWSYPNIHGDVIATADQAGVKQGATMHWGPYGENLTTIPDNSAELMDYGWLGQHQRPLEHHTGLAPTIEMGARQYDPTLGRFLEVDPIEGGSCNDYEYVCGDAINAFDLDGEICFSCAAKSVAGAVKKVKKAGAGALGAAGRGVQRIGNVASTVGGWCSYVPGAVGVGCGFVAAAGHAVNGRWRQAAIAGVGGGLGVGGRYLARGFKAANQLNKLPKALRATTPLYGRGAAFAFNATVDGSRYAVSIAGDRYYRGRP